MDYFNKNGGKKKRTKIGSNSLKSKKISGNFGKKIINSVQKGGFSKSDFVQGNFYLLTFKNNSTNMYYYLTDKGFEKFMMVRDHVFLSRMKSLKNYNNVNNYINNYINLYNLNDEKNYGNIDIVDLRTIIRITKIERVNLNKKKLVPVQDKKFYFDGANLQGANLEGAILNNVNFDGANLQGANLEGAILNNVNFDGANLQGANLEGVRLNNVNFNKADLLEAKLEGAILDNVSFDEANLQRANLKKINVIGYNNVSFDEANLEEANLEEAKLGDASFKKANVSRARFIQANLTDIKLDESIIKNAIFNNAIISNDLRQIINNRKTLVASKNYINFQGINNKRNLKVNPNININKTNERLSNNELELKRNLQRLAEELYKEKISPLDKSGIIEKSVVNLLAKFYLDSGTDFQKLKNAVKAVRILLLRTQYHDLEKIIKSDNF